MAAKTGDTVRFLNDIGGGVIVRIKDNMAYVADEDGFETPMLLRECVVVAQSAPAEKTAKLRPLLTMYMTVCSGPAKNIFLKN